MLKTLRRGWLAAEAACCALCLAVLTVVVGQAPAAAQVTPPSAHGIQAGWLLDLDTCARTGTADIMLHDSDLLARTSWIRMDFRGAGNSESSCDVRGAYASILTDLASLAPHIQVIGVLTKEFVLGAGLDVDPGVFASAAGNLACSDGYARVGVWEIWNEPSLAETRLEPARYADILTRSSRVVRDCGDLVITGGETDAVNYLRGVDSAISDQLGGYLGLGDAVDGIGIHMYPGAIAENETGHPPVTNYLTGLATYFGKPLYITEFSWEISDELSQAVQCHNLVNAFEVIEADWMPNIVRAAVWFTLQDFPLNDTVEKFGLYDPAWVPHSSRDGYVNGRCRPAPPSNPVVAVVSQSELRVTWTDNSDSETGFRVFNGIGYVTVAANSTSYVWRGLPATSYFCFSVKAFNAQGESVSTAYACGTTMHPSSDAVLRTTDCMQHELPANDDSSTGTVPLPFGVNFYGDTFESLYVNNNGNVTFDAPLSTYTPFGLAGTNRAIIAPFFADVDTRVGSTVHYGWGETTYAGHRAFCVNWVNVGYYSMHTDKLNSFQLVIVQREDAGPGDVDIVFNYDQIQWETGDASGGTGGLGGVSAAAGFSNGSGQPGTWYQLAGSLANGAFLDSSATGLANTSTDDEVPGRHAFRVRSGAAPQTAYVALGDSFQSGEGAGSYIAPTDSDVNRCHRSEHAYPQRLVDQHVVDLQLNFGACSGATIEHLSQGEVVPDHPPYNDGIAQLDRLDASTKLVTLGIGGNDLGFATRLGACVEATLLNPFSDFSCEQEFGEALRHDFEAFKANDRLGTVYRSVRERAPFARIVVVNYPRFFVAGGATEQTADEFCAAGMRRTDQRWVNALIKELDDYIAQTAGELGLQVVDLYDTPQGHELCGPSSEHFMNGIWLPRVESYHPNEYGHGLIADAVAAALRSPAPGELFNVLPDETLSYPFQVATTPSLAVATQWPGSDVVLSLTSPSGHTYTRSTNEPGVQHLLGPTFETYRIPNPEAGTWTATLYGARVAPHGEETRITVYTQPVPNAPPAAAFTHTFADRTVTVDAGPSHDPDGMLTEYVWDFGDGTTATGTQASHTYSTPGTYLVTLAVKDDRGAEAFASASSIITIPRYSFTGFGAPVNDPPTVNTMRAGQAVPLKFGIGGYFGLDILPNGSPASVQVGCDTNAPVDEIETTATPGNSTLSYDPVTGLYHYVWDTETSWADSCRRLDLTLNDGTTHQAIFRFRR